MRAFRVLLLSLLGVFASWGIVAAQSAFPQIVTTDAGVTVAVPAGLRQASGLGTWPDTPVRVEGLATFTDDADQPLTIQVRKGDAHGWESLPAANSARASEWTQSFAAELQLPEAYDFTPGRYDPERGALSLQYKVHGPSSARLMERLPDTHPLWAPTLQAGEEPRLSKCVLRALLGGQPSASEAELLARAGTAAAACGLPQALVSKYLQQLGPAEFAPAVTTVTYLAFFSRFGTIGTFVMAPLERQQAVDEAAALIWSETEVAPAARLPVASAIDAFRLAQLAGIALGSALGVLLLGGALSWLLVRLGLRARLAVGSTLGLLCALALTGLLRTGALQLEGGAQLGCYLVASVLGFRPLVRWLSSRGGSLLRRSRSLRGTRGLSTVEYIVVLVLVACVALGAWKLFGSSVQQALSHGSDRIGALAQLPLADGPSGAEGSQSSRARGAATGAPDRPGGGASSGSRSAGSERAQTGGSRATTQTDTGMARSSAGQGSSSTQPGGAARGDALLAAAASALRAMQPGRTLEAAAASAPLPANAGRVLASEAKGPSLLLRGADIATDFVPYLSNVKDATIAITGVNPVTKEQVGTFGRVVAGVFAIPAAGNLAKYVSKGAKYVLEGGKVAYEAGKAAKIGTRLAGVLGREAEKELAEEGAERLLKEAERGGEKAAAAGAGGYIRGLGHASEEFTAIKPGPLADELAGTFAGGRYREVVLESDTVLHRAGTAEKPLGQFFSTEAPGSVIQTRIDKAVQPRWPGGGTSPIDTAFQVKIPAGTKVYVGEVGSQGGHFVGGTQQIVVKEPWLIDGVQVVGSTPLK
jgi:hypothetical protein